MDSNKRKEQSGTKGCSVGYERSVGDEEEGRECVENLERDRIVYKGRPFQVGATSMWALPK